MADDYAEFAFFAGLSGKLHIELTKAPVQISPDLLNEKALPGAEIKSISFEPYIWTGKDFRDLTEDEWRAVAWKGPAITLRGEGGVAVTHEAPNGASFTVRELTALVAETERVSRHQSEWFGGIDVHHVFYEGIQLGEDGVGSISWGS